LIFRLPIFDWPQIAPLIESNIKLRTSNFEKGGESDVA
jgi:hypothetical protein